MNSITTILNIYSKEASIISLLGYIIVLVFFWVRGNLKSNKNDIIISIVILVIACLLRAAITMSCVFISDISFIIFIFGLSSIFSSYKVEDENALIKKDSLRKIGIFCCFAGFLFSMHA